MGFGAVYTNGSFIYQLGVKTLHILQNKQPRKQKLDASYRTTAAEGVRSRVLKYIAHPEPIYVKLLPIFVAVRGLAPPEPCLTSTRLLCMRPYYISPILGLA